MRLEVVDIVEAVSQLVNKGYDREYRIKDGYLFDLALNSPLDPRDIHVDTALRFEPLVFLLNRPRLGSTSEGTLHRGSRRTLTAVSVRSSHAVQSPAVRLVQRQWATPGGARNRVPARTGLGSWDRRQIGAARGTSASRCPVVSGLTRAIIYLSHQPAVHTFRFRRL